MFEVRMYRTVYEMISENASRERQIDVCDDCKIIPQLDP